MDRRDLIKVLPAVVGISLSPAELTGFWERVSAASSALPANDSEVLIAALADTILPATTTPSASEVGVPAFITLYLEDVAPADMRDRFYAHLNAFNARCEAMYGRPFEQMDTEIRNAFFASLCEMRDPFCNQIKYLTLVAYFTSEQGMTLALDYNPIPGSYNPCLPVTENTKTEASYF